MATTPEFDAFGPWIDEVRTADQVPPLYRAHPIDLEAARVVLKVPRPIERRNASPTMNLYDHLLIAGTDALTVLSREGDAYRERSVPYDRVGASQLSVSLLDGRLRLLDATPGTGGELLSLGFNGVSLGTVEQLVDLLVEQAVARRDAAPDVVAPVGTAPGVWSVAGADVALVVAYRELAERNPGLVRLADHGRVPVGRLSTAWTARLLDRLRPATVHAAVVAYAPGRVEVLHRRELVSQGSRPIHSIARTTLLASAVTAVVLTPHPTFAGALSCRLSVGDAVVQLVLPEGAPTVRALREALALG